MNKIDEGFTSNISSFFVLQLKEQLNLPTKEAFNYFLNPTRRLKPDCITRKLSAVRDDDVILWSVSLLGRHRFDLLDDAHPLQHLAEHDVLSIQVRSGHSRDEKLRSC